MPRHDVANGLLTLKAVFYGPARSGKTTNIRALHEGLPTTDRSELVTVDSDAERTLYFDYFSSDLGKLGPLTVRAEFYSVPGQAYYAETRRLILDGVDGIAFVADSDPARQMANRTALDDLHRQLEANGLRADRVPMIFQYNKRDLADRVEVEELTRMLDPGACPVIEASAVQGIGVEETANQLLRRALAGLQARTGLDRT